MFLYQSDNLFFMLSKLLPAEKLSQIILGGQDGLVNTFGVILGVAAASADIKIVIAGGLAACFAESISMGAVSYTSQRADKDHFEGQLGKTRKQIDSNPKEMKLLVRKVYQDKGFRGKELDKIVELITSNKGAWESILMNDYYNLSGYSMKDAVKNANIVFFSALVGSLIPLLPFFFFSLRTSIILSVIFSAVTLFSFGYYKGKITVGRPVFNGVELLVIGMTAAVLGYAIGWFFGYYA